MSFVTAVGFLLCLLNLRQIQNFVITHRKLQLYEVMLNLSEQEVKPRIVEEQVIATCPTIKCPSPVTVKCPIIECVCKQTDNSKAEFKVPNIVHYTWYASPQSAMTFQHYIAILSAYKILKPDKIYIHMNVSRPMGRYWDKIVKLDSVEALNEGLPSDLLGVKLIPDNQVFLTDSCDIGRIKYLLQYGGIYLSYDIIVIKPFDELRRSHEFTLIQDKGMQISYGLLSNSIVMSAKNAPFLYLWANSYLEGFQLRRWSYNLIQKPTTLYKRFPQAMQLTSDKFRLSMSDSNTFAEVWGNQTFRWRDIYAVCIPYRFLKTLKNYRRMYGAVDPDENNIVYMNNTYGEIARYILSYKHLMRIRD